RHWLGASNPKGSEKDQPMLKACKPDNRDEQLLIGQVRDGNSDAFDELACKHRPQIYGISLRFFGSPADAEDNVQNALCKAYVNFNRFEGRSRFSTWLTRIAINEALMTIRNRRSEAVTIEADLLIPENEDAAVLEVQDHDANQERRYIAKELA